MIYKTLIIRINKIKLKKSCNFFAEKFAGNKNCCTFATAMKK